jgi:hypothetical protein
MTSNKIRGCVVRGPAELCRQMDSRTVTRWLGDYLRQPHHLAADPGSGEARVALYLPARAVRALTVYTNRSAAESLRRLAVTRLDGRLLAPRQAASLPVRSTVPRFALRQALALAGPRSSAIFDNDSGQVWDESRLRWVLPGARFAPQQIALPKLHGQKIITVEPDEGGGERASLARSAEMSLWAMAREVLVWLPLVVILIGLFVLLFYGAFRSRRDSVRVEPFPVEPWTPEGI